MFFSSVFPVCQAFKPEQELRNTKLYHLFSHIFLPPFARIIIITLTGPLGLCVIQIFGRVIFIVYVMHMTRMSVAEARSLQDNLLDSSSSERYAPR